MTSWTVSLNVSHAPKSPLNFGIDFNISLNGISLETPSSTYDSTLDFMLERRELLETVRPCNSEPLFPLHPSLFGLPLTALTSFSILLSRWPSFTIVEFLGPPNTTSNCINSSSTSDNSSLASNVALSKSKHLTYFDHSLSPSVAFSILLTTSSRYFLTCSTVAFTFFSKCRIWILKPWSVLLNAMVRLIKIEFDSPETRLK